VELRDYVRVLRKSWALILAVTIVGIALGVGLTLVTTKVYQASTEVFVSSTNSTDTTGGQLGQTSNFVEARVQSYPNLATSPSVLGKVLDDSDTKAALAKAHTTLTEQQLAAKVSADAPQNKVIINLHVTDTNPATAAALANVLTKYFCQQVANNFEQKIVVVGSNGKSKLEPAVKLSVSKNAVVPSTPIKPNKVLNIGVGLVLGLLIGIAVAIVREVLDNTVKNARDFEEMGIPLLAQVAFDKRAARSPIAFRGDAHSARSEAYRQLRTNLQFVDVDNPPRIIAVTSAVPGEGKTSTAINLAASLAEAGGRVCLIEADLRRPSIAKALGLVSDVGFTTVVIGKAPVETVLQNAGKNLAVLTCGPIPPNPSELLISKHAKQVILDIAEKVDFVIIDTPPLLPVTDGAEIATIADATLLVHRAAKTTRDQALRSIEALQKVGRRPVGVILNMVTRHGGGRYDYEYGYYYSAYRPTTDKKAPAATQEAPAATEPTTESKGATAASSASTGATAGASATAAEAANPPKGRRARHRGARRAAAEQAAAARLTAADTDSFTPVNETAAAQKPATAPDADTEVTAAAPGTDEVADAPTDTVPVVEAAVEDPAPASTGQPVEVAEDDFADDFADEYDDLYVDEGARVARGAAEDDTVEFDAVQIDGQEELPLNERINGRGDADEHSFDDALGVRGERR
jgi:capsular exopolysaccharide synthesis family protein